MSYQKSLDKVMQSLQMLQSFAISYGLTDELNDAVEDLAIKFREETYHPEKGYSAFDSSAVRNLNGDFYFRIIPNKQGGI